MPPADDQLLGLSEVAELLGTSRQVVSNWRQRREEFPEPAADLKSGPIWMRAAIVEWAKANDVSITDPAEIDGEDEGHPPRAGMTVSLMNMKGGVGKSTLTANLGWAGAYLKDYRVLLVDLDPQFNLSQYVLGTKAYEQHLQAKKGTVLDILEQGTPTGASGRPRADIAPENVIATVKSWGDGSGIDLLPSSLDLSFTLKNPTEKEYLLHNFLEEVRPSYDLILIDCAPTESILTTAAYLASDSILIPVKPEFLSTIGLPLVVKSLANFKRSHKKAVDVLGIVFNAAMDKIEHDRSRTFVRDIAKQEGWYVFSNEVSYSDSYPKGSRLGTPIFLTDYARGTKIADFNAVANEFYDRLDA
jgi:chromosome partitioning protein